MLTDRVEISSQTRKEVLLNHRSGQLFSGLPRGAGITNYHSRVEQEMQECQPSNIGQSFTLIIFQKYFHW